MEGNPNSLLEPGDLKKVEDIVSEGARKLAPSFISSYIESGSIQKEGTVSIVLRVNLKGVPEGSAAKAARAYEWGSGIHSSKNYVSKFQLGPKGKIRIVPRKAAFLAFDWQGPGVDLEALHWSRIAHWKKRKAGEVDGLPSFAGIAPDGKLLFNHVEHPGVQAANNGRGYMRLSLEVNKEKINREIAKSAAEKLKLKIRSVFTRPGGSLKK